MHPVYFGESNLTQISFRFQLSLNPDGTFSIDFLSHEFAALFSLIDYESHYDVHSFFDTIGCDELPALLSSFRESAELLKPWNFEWRIEKDGRQYWLTGNATPFEKEGKIQWYGYIQDITTSKSSDLTMSIIQEKDKLLFQTMQEGLVIHDMSGKILSANRSAEQILGLTFEQMVGLTSIDPRWQAVNEHGEYLPGENHPAMVTIQTKIPIKDFIMGVRKANGNLTWISINTQVIYHPNTKEAIQVFAVFHDISERKKTEEALIESKLKAESADKIKSSFLANVSHEIRTPLNAIIGYTDLMMDENHSDETKQQLAIIKNSGNLLLNIINDILDLSKIDANQMQINEFPFSIFEIAKRTEETATILMNKKKKNLHFHLSVDSNLPKMMLGDEFRILQVILNLVNNAIKFTEKGKIEVCFKSLQKDLIEISVQDTGKGIKTENFERIFLPFQQEDFSDAREFGGTGLGLTISKKLIEKMNGTISFSSSTREEHGSLFKIMLPIKSFDSDSGFATSAAIQSNANYKARKNKILIAEDDTINQILAKKILVSAGFIVSTASNGNEAVDLFKEEEFDLILMDVHMPDKTGFEATAEIRSLEKEKISQKRIPIVFLSAAAMVEDRERGLEAGGDWYLTKPIVKEELLDVINQFND
ncbi:response regulator [Leptospira ognonensis]|uniref:Sensory/regulatory protein RpfC n=1 Tax=Leptospira ognonensis TaxID=2484945 RepID=A0A4R9JX44_9LEPT|nr:ATP-binding protein [Leptospira ognonensis]TGL56634.1 response regulator [Leptospira ognonensis]